MCSKIDINSNVYFALLTGSSHVAYQLTEEEFRTNSEVVPVADEFSDFKLNHVSRTVVTRMIKNRATGKIECQMNAYKTLNINTRA